MAERRKLVMLGMAGVGKTSIVNRIVDDTFDDNERTTIGGRRPEAMFTLSRTRELHRRREVRTGLA
jgi:GTPase SAR1 family protein